MLLSINRKTIDDYVNRAKSQKLDFATLAKSKEEELQEWLGKVPLIKLPDKQRKEALLGWFPDMQTQLGHDGVDRFVLWEEYCKEHENPYSYNHFCREYKRWCVIQNVSGFIDHKIGDKIYLDFAGKKMQITCRETGKVKNVEVFVGILGFSEFTYVEATASQKREDVIRATENALRYIGGVPQALVCDNLKSAVYKACKYEPELNEAYERFALHYSTVILPTRPRKPKDKSLVEGAVKITYRRIKAVLRKRVFYSIEELNKAIRELLVHYNNKVSKGAKDTRRNLLEQEERKELKPLPLEHYDMYEYAWCQVYKTSYILLSEDRHYYSVPYELIGKRLKVVYNSRTVEVYYHMKRVALHNRDYTAKGRTTINEHLPANLQFLNEVSAEKIISWASCIGEFTKQLVTIIINSRPHFEQARKSCMGILHLGKKVGKERIEKACHRAIYFDNYCYRAVKNILQNNLESEPLQTELELDNYRIGDHENIRGSSYYQ
jgi:transposase